MHNPNPFDFIPFHTHPFLHTAEEFDHLGSQVSGFLEVKLTALTPIHVVGSLERQNKTSNSQFYRQDGAYCIPASTMRGCLRAFVEALTSGWVSQATAEYPKEYTKRHVGFQTFGEYQNQGRTIRRKSPPAIDPVYQPKVQTDGKIDVASYLFGIVAEAINQGDEVLARKGKVWIEDAFLPSQNIVDKRYWVPDIDGDKAFMGGAKPSTSNWWYFQPAEIWKRRTRGHEVAEFIGGKFWGRKFYYHQDPIKCTQYYDEKNGNWQYKSKLHKVYLECMEAQSSTDTFRIYLDHVPEPLVQLLVLALMPGSNIRHKLGYGKAYGYGSIEFTIESAQLRRKNLLSRIPTELQSCQAELETWKSMEWHQGKLAAVGIDKLIDWGALAAFARVLGWQEYNRLLFTYPPFSKTSFMQPVQHTELKQLAPSHIPVSNSMKVNQKEALEIAKALFKLKKPLHFHYYQEQARGWDIISRRKP